jgi:hypothetical protein
MCGGDGVTRLFTIKCMIKEYPILLTMIATLVLALMMAIMNQIVECGIIIDPYDNSRHIDNRFIHFGDSLWFIFVTFTTVGYGDYYPKTMIGRVIAVAAALVGSFTLSLLVVMVDKEFLLIPKEQRILNFIDRVNSKDNIRTQSSKYIMTFMKYYKYKREIVNELERSVVDTDLVKEKADILKEVIFDRIAHKRKFKRFIQ